MTKTIDALVEALEACTTEEGPTQEELNRARAALAQARAEQAEPVVWRHKLSGHFTTISSVSNSQGWEPLYTAPTAAPVAKLEPLQAVANNLRQAGATLPAPELKGTIESAVQTGLSIALALVEAEIKAAHNAKLGGAT